MVWKKTCNKRRRYEVFTPSCSVGKWGAMNLNEVKIYHYPLSGDYHVGNNLVLNCHGTYQSLQMAKRIAQGVIRHGLKWNVITGKSAKLIIMDEGVTIGDNLANNGVGNLLDVKV